VKFDPKPPSRRSRHLAPALGLLASTDRRESGRLVLELELDALEPEVVLLVDMDVGVHEP
jgi:hypothetical protein